MPFTYYFQAALEKFALWQVFRPGKIILEKMGPQNLERNLFPPIQLVAPFGVPRKSEGEIASEVFSLRRQGSKLEDIVIHLHISPDLAKIYSDKYDEFVGNMILTAAEKREINSSLPLGSFFYDSKSLKNCFQKILEEREDYKTVADSFDKELRKLRQITNYFTFPCSVCGGPVLLTKEVWNSLKNGDSLRTWTHVQCNAKPRYEIIYS